MNSDIIKQKQSDEKFCSACGKIIHASAALCPGCGATQIVNSIQPQFNNQQHGSQISNLKYCEGCGSQVHQSAQSCPKCGAIMKSSGIISDKSRNTAIILALLLGGIGGHKFYLGKPIQGFFYLIFCWTFIPGIVAFIEFLIYLSWSDQKFHERVKAGTA